MPYPAPCGWRNVVYSGHFYHFTAKSEDDQQRAIDGYIGDIEALRQSRTVPFYLGEFGLEPHGTPALVAGLVDALGQKSISWSLWTYKIGEARRRGAEPVGAVPERQAGHAAGPVPDSEAEWISKCAQLRTEALDENTALAQALRGAARTGRLLTKARGSSKIGHLRS